MDRQIIGFIDALRTAGVPVSSAETIDAVNAVAVTRYASRALIHDTLAVVLAKTVEDKQRFDICFARFFSSDVEHSASGTMSADTVSADELLDNVLDNVFDDGEPGDSLAANDEQHSDSAGQDESSSDEPAAQGDGDRAASSQGLGMSSPQGGELGEFPQLDIDQLYRLLDDADHGKTHGDDNNDINERGRTLVKSLLENDRAGIELAIRQAANHIEIQQIAYTTQRSIFIYRLLQALGAETAKVLLDRLSDTEQAAQILALEASEDIDKIRASEMALALSITDLQQQVTDYVENQMQLYADVSGELVRESLIKNANLSGLEHQYFDTMQRLVKKMAKALVAKHSRRRRIPLKGQLDVAKTIRRNVANQGVLFNTYWKTKKKDIPEVFAICDVSGSVSAYAKFLLLFLYSLQEVIPKTRAFAFSSQLGEVTELFRSLPVAQAVEQVNHLWGYGATDYGAALSEFAELAMDDIRSTSTVIIMGDARNNHGDAQLPILREIYQRCQRVVWLNPEGKGLWGVGDSEMRRYSSCVHQADTCQSIAHLENTISQLLRIVD